MYVPLRHNAVERSSHLEVPFDFCDRLQRRLRRFGALAQGFEPRTVRFGGFLRDLQIISGNHSWCSGGALQAFVGAHVGGELGFRLSTLSLGGLEFGLCFSSLCRDFWRN